MRNRGRIVAIGCAVTIGAATFAVWRFGARDRREAGRAAPEREPARRATRLGSTTSANALAWMEDPRADRRRIAGVVLERGAPVAGATVERRSYRAFLLGEAPQRAVTDRDGRFDFGEQAPTTHVVLASTDAARAHEVVRLEDPSRDPPPDRLVIGLVPCPRRVRGRVRDPQGRAIAGALVEARTTLDSYLQYVPLFGVATREDGTFEWCAPSAPIVVSARGYESVMLGRDPPARDWDVVLHPESIVEGVVVDGDREPMPGVVVTLRGDGYAKLRAAGAIATVSSDDGSFRFAGVGPGEYSLAGDSPVAYSSYSTRPSVHVPLGGRVTGVILTMTRCDRGVAGRVVEQGRPVAGATISIAREAITARDGSFEIACVPSARRWDVTVHRYDVVQPKAIEAGKASIDDLVVEVTRRAEIRGRVVADGSPISGATVAIGDPAAPVLMRSVFGESWRARSAPDGSYALRGVPAGEHEIAAIDRATGRRSDPVLVRIDSNEIVAGIDLSLSRGGTIRGRVVDRDGNAVANLRLRVSADGSTRTSSLIADAWGPKTGPDGRFEIAGLGKGRYRIEAARHFFGGAEPPGRADVELPRDDAIAEVEIRLAVRATLSIEGSVIYEDGSAASFARVRGSFSDTIADEAGRFSIAGLDDGAQVLGAVAIDGSRGSIEATAGARHVVIELRRVGHLEGRVVGVGPSGKVTARAVSGVGREAGVEREVMTDDGRFRMPSIPAAHYRVIAEGSDGVADAFVTVEPGKTATIELVVGSPGRIEGIARRFPSDEPMEGLSCVAGTGSGVTDSNGAFVIERVLPGESVEVSCQSLPLSPKLEWTTFATGKTTISVEPGGTAVAEVFVVVTDARLDADFTPGDLGASLFPVTHEGAPALAFSDVVPGGPAEGAGIRDGDVLIEVDGGAATGPRVEAVDPYVRSRSAGTRLALKLSRAGSVRTTVIVTGTWIPAAP